MLRICNFNDTVDEDTRRDDIFRLYATERNDFRYLYDRPCSSHTHEWIEITRSHAVGQIAVRIAKMRFNERKISFQPTLLHVRSFIKFSYYLAFGEFRAIGCRRVERRDTSATCPDTLSKRSLRYKFQIDFTGNIFVRESARIGRPRNEQIILRTIPASIIAAMPMRPLPALLLITVKFFGPYRSGHGSILLARLSHRTPDHDRSAIAYSGNSLGQTSDCLVHFTSMPERSSFVLERPVAIALELATSSAKGQTFCALFDICSYIAQNIYAN